MPVSLQTLLDAAPYLSDLYARHGAWFGAAIDAPDAGLAAELDRLRDAGRDLAAEDDLSRELRIGKGRLALLAAAAECLGHWTTAQSTAALSDLADAAAARTNLGLGSMSIQNASAVAITGGSVDGVTLDGGTF